jgi:hypothetical protein
MELPEIQTIKKVTAGPNDRFIIEVEVGRMPPSRIKTYIADLMARMEGFFPKDSCIFVPMIDGKPGMRLSVVTKEAAVSLGDAFINASGSPL